MALIEDFENLAKEYLKTKNNSAGENRISENNVSELTVSDCEQNEQKEVVPINEPDSIRKQSETSESICLDVVLDDVEYEPGNTDIIIEEPPLDGIIPLDGDIDFSIPMINDEGSEDTCINNGNNNLNDDLLDYIA